MNQSTATRDYQRVAQAIIYLQRHAASQPDLATVARALHLSQYRFQRLFTRWAGVSPKRFLQYLTVENAKARLAAGNLLDVAAQVGLSGAGRLHDLFVTLEALSPGEFKSGGAGLRIAFGMHASPFGDCVVGTTRRGICALQFIDRSADAAAALRRDWPDAELVRDDAAIATLARRIFEPLAARHLQPLALVVRGTNFQLKVWRALIALPLGALTSYGGIAQAIGQSNAARAVGAAIGANPVAWLIPCHRVIRESGALAGYRWGTERKAAMLGWEAVRTAAAAD
ncbi:MAG: methylated-DNA--[protein]-cysteine S-methyltransferase [Betaproteobacteria bacterium]|nr:methylated-DNA--[protein]-cysteine S-methyltransferase [Betaproteobacteria bacterium]